MRIWQAILAALLILSSGLGLLIMSGNARDLFAPQLQAALHVQEFPMPPDMGVDPTRVAEFMAAQLQRRMEGDVAIRLMLDDDAADKVQNIVLPRLMTVVAVQAMMREIPELSELLDMDAYRRTVTGTITSRAEAADVALTVPGLLLATVDGNRVAVTTTSTGMKALELGTMAAGQSHELVLWLNADSTDIDLGRTIRLGAANGEAGQVLLWGDRGWFGADVEVLRWGRWLIGAVLAAVFVFGLASLMLPFLKHRSTQ